MTTVIERSSPVVRSPRVIQMESMFDVPAADHSAMRWEIDLPLDEQPWSVGLIIGPSGAGKSTLARELWGERVVHELDWPEDRSVLDAFPETMGVKQVVAALGAVGFNSPPSWLRPPTGCSPPASSSGPPSRACSRSRTGSWWWTSSPRSWIARSPGWRPRRWARPCARPNASSWR